MALLSEAKEGMGGKISQILFCAAIPFWPLFFSGTRLDRSFICENTKELAKGASLTFIQWMATWPPFAAWMAQKKDVPKFTAASGCICDPKCAAFSFGAFYLKYSFLEPQF
jgi:hypothetical protein